MKLAGKFGYARGWRCEYDTSVFLIVIPSFNLWIGKAMSVNLDAYKDVQYALDFATTADTTQRARAELKRDKRK